jgi:prolyl 4-hydroxylase
MVLYYTQERAVAAAQASHAPPQQGDPLGWLPQHPSPLVLAKSQVSSSEESSRIEEESQNDVHLQRQQYNLNLLASVLLPNHRLLQNQHSGLVLGGMIPQQHQQQQQQQIGPRIPTTHNLIPLHLQADAMAASLNGTPGHQAALIPGFASMLAAQQALAANMSSYCVQNRPLIPPVYNGVNPNYPGLRLLNANPPVFAVDQFLTPFECQFLVHSSNDCFGPAPVVGKGAGEISSSRTSSTCYLAREDLPDYLRKVSMLTGKPVEHCELPQVGRYFPSQQYLQHFDAFDLSDEDGRRFAANGGQRTVTVLVYLNDVHQGGQTAFPALNLEVQPRQGMAIVFFPATVDGLLDKMALHAARPAVDTKYVSQVWIRQGEYQGQPSKRLSQTLGVPFGTAPPVAPMPAPGAAAGF